MSGQPLDNYEHKNMKIIFAACALILIMGTGANHAYGANASNPLAAVSNTDLRAQYFDLGGSDLTDYFVDGV